VRQSRSGTKFGDKNRVAFLAGSDGIGARDKRLLETQRRKTHANHSQKREQLHDLPAHRLAVIKRFFEDFKALENKKVVVKDILPLESALPLVEQGCGAYRKQFSAVK
jgi:inorganic pyrophosphatase